MPTLQIQSVIGANIAPHLDALAKLRIEVFREWPYLYEGTLSYEQNYLQHYPSCPQCIVVLALDGDRVVGASTAMPLSAADAQFQKAFEGSRYAINSIFHLGESMLLPKYRGQGIGHHFFDAREAQARTHGALYAAFCSVDRDVNDCRRPEGYHSLDAFWKKRGYVKHPHIQATFDWREIEEAIDSSHTLTYWIKELSL